MPFNGDVYDVGFNDPNLFIGKDGSSWTFQASYNFSEWVFYPFWSSVSCWLGGSHSYVFAMYAQKSILCVQYDAAPQSCQVFGRQHDFVHGRFRKRLRRRFVGVFQIPTDKRATRMLVVRWCRQ